MESSNINRPILLVEFANGRLKSLKKECLNYNLYKRRNTLNLNPERILVAKSSRLCYLGSNYENDFNKISSCLLKVCILNKKDSTVKFYNADIFNLKPKLECPEVFQSKETKSYSEMSSDLTIAFGSKTKQKMVNTKMKYSLKQTSDNSDIGFTMPETVVEVENGSNTSNVGTAATVIPPQNSTASSVDEVYNLYDIIAKDQYDALDSEAAKFLTAKYEDYQQWKKENKYLPFIIEYAENHIPTMNLHKAKLLCYLQYMTCFLKTMYKDWKRKDPVPSVPHPFKQKLMDSFTVNKSLPQRMKDKLLANVIVLSLILNDYVFNSKGLALSAKIAVKNLVSVAYALGCHVSENKQDGSKIIQLKLPLYKHQPMSKRKRSNM